MDVSLVAAHGCPGLSTSLTLLRKLARAPANLSAAISSNCFAARRSFSLNSSAFPCESSTTDVNVTQTATNSAENGYPQYHRLLPCTSFNVPPRVEHLVVLEGGPVMEYISKSLDLPPMYVADLIHFGAVYYALVCPQPPPTASSEEIRLFKKFTQPSFLISRKSIKGKTLREAQKTFRITRIDEFVEVGTYLRVYVHPKRFPRCYEIDWKSRIIAVTDSYVVLDKPAGTSVCGWRHH